MKNGGKTAQKRRADRRISFRFEFRIDLSEVICYI